MIFGIEGDEGGPDQVEMCLIPRAGFEDPPFADQAIRAFRHQPVSSSLGTAPAQLRDEVASIVAPFDRLRTGLSAPGVTCLPSLSPVTPSTISSAASRSACPDTAPHVLNHCSGNGFQTKEQRFLFGT